MNNIKEQNKTKFFEKEEIKITNKLIRKWITTITNINYENGEEIFYISTQDLKAIQFISINQLVVTTDYVYECIDGINVEQSKEIMGLYKILDDQTDFKNNKITAEINAGTITEKGKEYLKYKTQFFYKWIVPFSAGLGLILSIISLILETSN